VIPPKDWKWFGKPGHFICGDRCAFHLATKVGNYMVSTIGEYKVERNDNAWSEIGAGRLYETMVFRADTGICDVPSCGCGMPIHDGNNVDFAPYNTAGAASDGHMEMCRKWAVMP